MVIRIFSEIVKDEEEENNRRNLALLQAESNITA